MPEALRISSAEDAATIFFEILEGRRAVDFDRIEFSPEFTLTIRLPTGYRSEVPGPFLDAFFRTEQTILRFIAFVESGNADIKTLGTEGLSRYQYSVRVSDGSSKLQENIEYLLGELATSAFAKMDGTQAVITILGLALLIAFGWGVLRQIEARRQVRLEQIQSDERKKTIETLVAANSEQIGEYTRVVGALLESGEAGRRAASAADEVNSYRLRAASQVNETEFDDFHISGAEARELRSGSRRKSRSRTITQDMKVVDVNTADPAHTSVVIEDLVTGEQSRVTFRDSLIEEANRKYVYDALEQRAAASFTLKIKEIEGETVSVEILEVGPETGTVEETELEDSPR